MRGRWLLIVALASLGLNAAVVGSFIYFRAHPEHRPLGRHERHRRPGLPFRRLNPEQRRRVERTFRSSGPFMDTLRQSEDSLRAALVQELLRPDYSPARVESLAAEAGRLHGRMLARAFRDARSVVESLPEAERERFIREIRPELRGPGPRRRPGPGCPDDCPPPGPDGD
jgi:hypothetical protein